MQYGVVLPTVGAGGDARTIATMAREAEEAGWDGVFVWDCINMEHGDAEERKTYDPEVVMAALAMNTERVRFGALVTPLSRRRPWKVARETVTLDHLSNGRFVLLVGLGATDDGGFSKVGEELDRKKRAQMLDESLAILTGLWSGQPFSFDGEHYHIQEMAFTPPPVQSPRIPIWAVGAWRRPKSLRRALSYDGIIPTKMSADGSFADMTPDDMCDLAAYIHEQRSQQTPYDIIMEGETPGDDRERALSIVRPYAESGVTWWLESVWRTPETEGGVEGMRARVRQGPPK